MLFCGFWSNYETIINLVVFPFVISFFLMRYPIPRLMMLMVNNSYHYIVCFFGITVLEVKKCFDKTPARTISTSIETMLKTGRLVTNTGLDLQQVLTCHCLVKLYIFLYFPAANCLLFLSLYKILPLHFKDIEYN